MYTPYAYNLYCIFIFLIFLSKLVQFIFTVLTSYMSKQWQNKTAKTEKYKSM